MKKVIYIIITLFCILMFSGCGSIVQIKNLKDDVKIINHRLDSLQVEVNKLKLRMKNIKNQSHQ